MIRVIAGRAGGRKLKVPKGKCVRPTQDRIKEALFSMLGDQVAGARVLDLYSGSGALGIEALSRGAISALFIDNNPGCVDIIQENLDKTGLLGKVKKGRVGAIIKKLGRKEFDLVFADPPYGKDLARNLLPQLDKYSILSSCSMVIIEHSSKESIAEEAQWFRVRERRYGDTVISVYRYNKSGTPCN